MYRLKILRHAPKIDSPANQPNLYEAELDPSKIGVIHLFVQNEIARLPPDCNIEVESTPVKRARDTAREFYNAFLNHGFKKVSVPSVEELLGQFGSDENGNPVRLVTKAMADLWNKGKEKQKIEDEGAEHESLRLWIECGLDSVASYGPDDTGISVREIALRIGTYLCEKLSNFRKGALTELRTYAFGHSADIEPFIYLLLEKYEGKNGEDKDRIMARYFETGRGLKPLQGIECSYDGGEVFQFDYPVNDGRRKLSVKLAVIESMVKEYKERRVQ